MGAPSSQLLTRMEAAQRLNVSLSTLKRLGRAGAVDEIRVGERLIRIDPGSVDAYIASRRASEITAVIRDGTRPLRRWKP